MPKQLRPGDNAAARSLGHGEGYRYPHDFEGAYVPEDYLPEPLVGGRYYQPREIGAEKQLKERLDQLNPDFEK